MTKPNFNYDEISDTLYVSFNPGETATGIELNDNILLRIDEDKRRAIEITFFEYSILAQKTEFGPRSFPLAGLDKLPENLKEIVFGILLHPPISDILTLSAYTPSSVEVTPITTIQFEPEIVN